MWGNLGQQIQAVAPSTSDSAGPPPTRFRSRGLDRRTVLTAGAAGLAGTGVGLVLGSGLSGVACAAKSLVLVPAIAWDWPKYPGMVSPDQYNFCDFMPLDPENSDIYKRSANSFSSNYLSFIRALEPSAPPPDLIDSALDDYANELYRSYVKYTSRPVSHRPSWYVRNYEDWIRQVAGQNNTEADRVMRFQGQPSDPSQPALLASCRDGSGKGWTNVSLQDKQHRLLMTAEAWGRISITPGEWYNSGFVGTKANGPYYTGYSRDDFFGPRGLLHSRVAELIVVYKPTLKLTVNGQLSPTGSERRLNLASELRVGPIRLHGGSGTHSPEFRVSTDSAGDSVVSGKSTSSTPFIVAVTVEFFV